MKMGRRLRCSSVTYRSGYAPSNCQSGSDRLEKQPTDLRRKARLFRGQDTRDKFIDGVGMLFQLRYLASRCKPN